MISEAQEIVQDSDQMIYQFSFMWLQQCLMIYHFRNHNGIESPHPTISLFSTKCCCSSEKEKAWKPPPTIRNVTIT